MFASGSQSFSLADIGFKVLWEMIFKERSEGNTLVTQKTLEVHTMPAGNLIEIAFYSVLIHWLSLMIFTSMLAIWALKFVSIRCVSEKPK
jgi:hypothetical protein